tara:strand:+ start:576 stop:755 length:180 start_codon:yes stop_codon:yes gene_type:complete
MKTFKKFFDLEPIEDNIVEEDETEEITEYIEHTPVNKRFFPDGPRITSIKNNHFTFKTR